MHRQFFKSLGWLVALNLLIKPVWIFGIDRQVQNAAGNAAYGEYFATLNLTIILLFIADAGLSNLLTQRLAAEPETDARQVFRLKAFLLFLYSVCCIATAWLMGITNWQLLTYLIMIQCFGSAFLFMRSMIAARQQFTADAWFSVADKSLVVVLCAPLILGWWGTVTIITFLRLQAVASLTACLALLVFIRVKNLLQPVKGTNALLTARALFPFAAVILLMSAHYRLDSVLLERLHPAGATQAGIYAAAYRLLDAANMIGYLAASFLLPFIARNKNNTGLVQRTTSLLQHVLVIAGIGAGCFAVVFASWVQQTLYHTAFSYNSAIIQLTMAVLPAYYITHVYGSVLTATGNLRVFIRILAAVVFINGIINIFLIPSLGAVACCIAAMLSQYSCAAACYLAACRTIQSKAVAMPWLLYIFTASLFTGLLWLLKTFAASVWIILAAIVIAAGVAVFLQRHQLKKRFQHLTLFHD